MAPELNHDKASVAIRYWLLAKEYYKALMAMEWAFDHHKGMRKDGKTPAITHQLSVVYYLRTIHQNLLFPEDTFCAAFLHDISEDCDVPIRDISNTFGEEVAASVRLLTRKPHTSLQHYYEEIGRSARASIVKASDRIHNVQTMIGVFDKEKQIEYVKETEDLVIPMIKDARRMFPQQEPSYENAKHMLRCQIELIEAIHGGKI